MWCNICSLLPPLPPPYRADAGVPHCCAAQDAAPDLSGWVLIEPMATTQVPRFLACPELRKPLLGALLADPALQQGACSVLCFCAVGSLWTQRLL